MTLQFAPPPRGPFLAFPWSLGESRTVTLFWFQKILDPRPTGLVLFSPVLKVFNALAVYAGRQLSVSEVGVPSPHLAAFLGLIHSSPSTFFAGEYLMDPSLTSVKSIGKSDSFPSGTHVVFLLFRMKGLRQTLFSF